MDLNQPRRKILQQLQTRIEAERQNLAALKSAHGLIAATDQTSLSANTDQTAAVTAKIDALEHQAAYFRQPAWRGFLLDLLVEDKSISFHRFQILVWTMTLGVMFASNVIAELAMPDFNATTLALLGISAGTYLGFKFPDSRAMTARARTRLPWLMTALARHPRPDVL